MGKGQQLRGEGNYEAARKYNEATKRFIEAGKVEEAANEAAPASDAEALQLAAAEAEGKSRAKEEDPTLMRKAPRKRRSGGDAGDPRGSRAPREGANDTPETAPEETHTPMPGEDGR